jgi:hypothetical protein
MANSWTHKLYQLTETKSVDSEITGNTCHFVVALLKRSMNISWENNRIINYGKDRWSPRDLGYKTYGSSNYAEYSNPEFVFRLFVQLMKSCHKTSYYCYFEGAKKIEHQSLNTEDLPEFLEMLRVEWDWGVWIFTSGSKVKPTTNIVQALDAAVPDDFLIYIDLDGGLLAACPSRYID